MTFRIEVKMENAAFDDDPTPEVVKILQDIAERLDSEEVADLDGMVIFDSNGAACGRVTVTKR